MKKTFISSILLIVVLAIPLTSSALTAVYQATPAAQVTTQTQSLNKITDAYGLLNRIASFGNVAVYLLVALAVVFIVYNVVMRLTKPGAEDQAKASMDILWGIIGLAIIVSLWGLVNILVNTFSTDNSMQNTLPNANFINTTNSGSSNSSNSNNNDYGGELNN